jgi:predicted acyltransferase
VSTDRISPTGAIGVRQGIAINRVASVDALRGLVILLMIFVNDVAGVERAPGWLKHASGTEDAMTLPDIVFPAFLFIVGLSIPLAFESAQNRGQSRRSLFLKILGRTASLLVMGVLMVNAEEYNPWVRGAWALLVYLSLLLAFGGLTRVSARAARAWSVARAIGWLGLVVLALAYRTPITAEIPNSQHLVLGPLFNAEDTLWLRHSWWGILGLIGWAYFAGGTLYLLLGRRREWLIGATGLLMLLYVAAQADYGSRLASRAWLDGVRPLVGIFSSAFGLVNGHVSIGESLGSLAAITMAGCSLGSILTTSSTVTTARERLKWATVFTIGLVVGGVCLDAVYGLNKIHATPAWCFLCAALTSAAWMLLYWRIDLRGSPAWSEFIQPAGANPLLAYLLHPLLYYIAAVVNLPLHFYQRPDWPLFVNIGGSLLMAVLVLQLTRFIARTGYRLKV